VVKIMISLSIFFYLFQVNEQSRKDKDWITANLNRKTEDIVNQLTQMVDQREAKIQARIVQLNESLEFKAENVSKNSKFEMEKFINQIQENITEKYVIIT
jgi:hypothetical protein